MLQSLSESKNMLYTSSSKIWIEMDDLQLPAYFMKNSNRPTVLSNQQKPSVQKPHVNMQRT